LGKSKETQVADTEKCSRNEWSINETLLQSYRSIFISSQSFLLAVGAIVSGKNHAVFYAIAAISLLMIWAIWFPVVRSRHLIVDYHKYGSKQPESEQSKLCTVEQYVENRKLRRQANELLAIKYNWRETRVKLDALMPTLISSVWFVLLIYEAS
jgi:hypothetical protein